MCIIIDANLFSNYINKTEDLAPVREWVDNGGGRIAYSVTPKMEGELGKNLDMEEYIKRRIRGPRVKIFPANQVIAIQNHLYDHYSSRPKDKASRLKQKEERKNRQEPSLSTSDDKIVRAVFSHLKNKARSKKNLKMSSRNDHHILALALLAKVKLLATDDDPLTSDFKRFANGSVYQDKRHADLLKNPKVCSCP